MPCLTWWWLDPASCPGKKDGSDPAGSLPSFFPGHEAGSSHHHVKHGLLALILGIGCFVFAWFQSGPSTARSG